MSTCNVTTVVGKECLKENARSDLEGENVYGTESVAQRCFFKKKLIKNFEILTGKHQSHFRNFLYLFH